MKHAACFCNYLCCPFISLGELKIPREEELWVLWTSVCNHH